MQRTAQGIGVSICLVLVMALMGCAGDQTSRSTGQYIDDSTVANKVKIALYADKQVSGRQIQVEVFKGVVQLSGFVDSAAEAQRAVQIAKGIDGVKEVRNSMVVK
jgi:osmotically-inducible protein OsmY